jgi:hypothetical protein
MRLTRRDIVDRLAGSKSRSAHLDWRICSIRMPGPQRYRRRILTIFADQFRSCRPDGRREDAVEPVSETGKKNEQIGPCYLASSHCSITGRFTARLKATVFVFSVANQNFR